ncbi:MAG: phytanoyl-CoA dioxygenase family protein [Gammaproteobacteria bacterium]
MKSPQPLYKGRPLDMSRESFGELRHSDSVLSAANELRQRMADDGYLYLPGLLELDLVKAVRRDVFDRLAKLGALHPDYPAYEGISHPKPDRSVSAILDYRTDGSAESLSDCLPIKELLYKGRMISFFEHFLGGDVLCFNHIWFRAKDSATGRSTPPHCDILYMGRGTHNLFTAWVPYTDIDYDMGGVMLLEKSHQLEELRESYCKRDIDVYDADHVDAPLIESGKKLWQKSGEYSLDAFSTREELGGRWLTAEFRMGDVLIFSPYIIHASTDNHSPRMRISSDTRYQLASEPADERWAGPNPIGHGLKAKRAVHR